MISTGRETGLVALDDGTRPPDETRRGYVTGSTSSRCPMRPNPNSANLRSVLVRSVVRWVDGDLRGR
jgi:hypothetical protein